MKKSHLAIIILLIILAFGLGFLFSKINLTGKTINPLEQSTATKAICNSNNECIDVVITCQEGEPIDLELSSNVKQLPANWKDPRPNLKNNLC